jgi:hypothetical protein
MKQYALRIMKRNNNNANVSKRLAFNVVSDLWLLLAKFDMNLLVKVSLYR